MRRWMPLWLVGGVVVAALSGAFGRGDAPAPLAVLLLGDDGHHQPADFAKVLTPALAKEGVRVDYTADVADLTVEKLAKYDALMIFRDSGSLPPANEAALVDFVEGGKGLVAVHCASHTFRNSRKYGALVGGRFLKHSVGGFRARIIDAQHPAMEGVKSFDTVDETYVHDQLGSDLRVLMVRAEAGGYEPYTWVREQGRGRVYYTALGHDRRTWEQPGFHRLLAQGVQWAAGRANGRIDLKPFEYVEANVPNYVPSTKWGTLGEPIHVMQKPLSPEESMKHLHVPEGFRVELFAAEPDLQGKPICMAWDARGRLWVAETVDYPNDLQPDGRGHDRIVICEDTDGDGRADKFTVFADKLSIPTGLAFANGGAIVAQAPQMLFLKDTDGDDKADVRKVLFSGWGVKDTHSGPSNLRPGSDNWVWGTVGYSGFVGEVGGKSFNFRQGIWRMKPDGSRLEFLGQTSNNTWGLGFNERGDVFGSTANGQHAIHLALPNRTFEGVRGWYGQGTVGIEDHSRIHPITKTIRQVDWHGGFTAAAGHAVYTARAFPSEYGDRAAFVCEPTGHLVHVDWLVPHGSAFAAKDGWNMLASDDEWTAPIAAEVGPDGALWVIDWYNFIVQHNPTPAGFKTGKGNAYETPLRDKTHGRIYRIVYEGAKPAPKPNLDKATPDELVKTLSNDNLWWRQTAQRLLVERGKRDVLPHLAILAREAKTGPDAVHALWTMHGLGAFADAGSEWQEVARAGLTQHPFAPARRAALGVLPRTAESAAAVLAAKSLSDDDPQVRRDALLALSEMPGSPAAAAALVAFLQEPRNVTDRWLPIAATAAAARSGLDFLEAGARSRPATPALVEAARVVAGHVARQAPADAPRRLLAALKSAPPALTEAILSGLANGWPSGSRVTLDAAADADLTALVNRLPPRAMLPLSNLLKRWGQQDKLGQWVGVQKKALLTRLADGQLGDEVRIAAARDLLALADDKDSVDALLVQVTPQAGPALTRGLLESLGESATKEVGTALVRRSVELTPNARATALNVLLLRPAWTMALLDGLDQGAVDVSDLRAEQAEQLSKHPNRTIAVRAAQVLARGGKLPDPDRQKIVAANLHLVQKVGDKVRGRAVFEQSCAKCHRHGSLGANVGPDLTGMAVRPKADLLVDILDPNRSVEGNYRQYTIETKKGLVLTGLLTGETQTAIEVMDAEAKKTVVLREDIAGYTKTDRSLMPEGFEKLPPEDLAALLEFLAGRDKFLPLPLGKAATAVSVRGMFTDPNNEHERLVFPTWGPQTFAGVPFQVIDPRDGSIPNAILLNSPNGAVSKTMPKSATVPCNAAAKAIHILGGVGGWNYPGGRKDSVSMIVRLHYADGTTEDHPLRNGVEMADYIRAVDVPGSRLAFRLGGRQVRYLAIAPQRKDAIASIEFVKGKDDSAPLVMAVTVEAPE